MTWWHYLLLANLYLTLFYGFYALFLRKETFFNLNRLYLVSAALLSFFIPLIQSEWIKNLFITQKVQQTINQVSPIVVYQLNVTATSNHLTLGQIVACVYTSGMLILTIKFIHQLIVLRQVIKDAETSASYSFFNNIKMEENDADNRIITAHEQAHARQLHSADILLTEAIMIINWFNPVVYLYRNAIKHIHEFIADRDAFKAGTDKAEYAMLLLSQTFSDPPHRMVNPFFSHSMLKERILMLQKNKSHRTALIKYGLSAPLFALMLVLSSATVNNSKPLRALQSKAEEMLSKTASIEVMFYNQPGEIPELKGTKYANNTVNRLKESPSKNIFTQVEQSAAFQGGINAFYSFINSAINYPAEAKKNHVQGKVYLTFVVEKDGSLSNIKVLRGIGSGCDEAAVEALKRSPKWIPGVQNNFIVRQQYTVPVNFALTDDLEARYDYSVKPASVEPGRSDIFTAVENSAEFPGGIEKFYQYLSRAIHYPADARKKNLQGKVTLTFIVETDGSLTDIKVLHGVNAEINQEAVRVIKASPRWKPGQQNGRLVRQQYTVPINFTLADKSGIIVHDTLLIGVSPGQRGEQLQNAYAYRNIDNNAKNGDTTRNAGHSFFSGLGGSVASSPLFVVNGIIAKPGQVSKINVNNIQSIDVIKGESATKLYGSKAAHGLIRILTLKRQDADADDD